MRPLEEHLSPQELASLPESSAALATGGLDLQPLWRHLQQCEACSGLAHNHWGLLNLRAQSSPGETCPPQDVWLEFSAGLHPEQTSLLLAHAAGCSGCAQFLKEAMQLMRPDQLEDAQAAGAVAGLASARPAWQRDMVAQMMAATDGMRPPGKVRTAHRPSLLERLRFQPRWITLSSAAALVCAVVLLGAGVWRYAWPSDARLLAQAYNQQRTLALRIPGAEPVAMVSITRGPNNGLAEPTALLELRLRAQQHLDKTPNSPYWHQVLGEIGILEGDGLAARRNLEIAQASDDKLPNLQQDLAAAWFEVGDTTGNAEAYAEAAELYSQQLQRPDADKALLYYNRALCWERQSLNANAAADLRLAMAAEPSAAWRAAMQAEIDRLATPPHARLDPLQQDGYETALDDATQRLLPLWNGSAEARARIRQTAALGLRHHDRWLLQWIAAGHTPLSADADRHLAAAVAAGNAGEAGPSLTEAGLAIGLYKQAGHLPGLLRAELARAYALQRLSSPRECLAATNNLKHMALRGEDAWIDTQSTLETAICEVAMGDLLAAQTDYDRGLRMSLDAQMPSLRLRAIVNQAFLLALHGRPNAAWNAYVAGLKLCDITQCPTLRKYYFLYDIAWSAQAIGLKNVATEVMQTAEQVTRSIGDQTTRLYALETLATLKGRIGDFQDASRGFSELDRLRSSGDQAAAVKLNQAEWDTDRAELLTRRGDPQEALAVLHRSAPALLSGSYQAGRVALFHQLAIAHGALHHDDEALADALASVKEAEVSLAGMHSTLAREQWAQANAPVYEELVKIHLQRGDTGAALQAWERLRRAPYADASDLRPAHPAAQSADQSVDVLVIARIDDAYIGWLADSRTLQPSRTVNLGDTAVQHRSALTFYRLCADRASSLADVHRVGGNLYNTLLKPFAAQLGTQQGGAHTGHLFLDLDPSLAMLPVSALTTPDGGWLGDGQQITVLPPWWSLHPESVATEDNITPAMKMVLVSGFSHVGSEVTELARLFPYSTVLTAADSRPGKVAQALASADLFHFAGHSSAEAGDAPAMDARVHGEADPPQSAGVTLATALTPEAVAAVRLPRSRLAVLAACNTTAADPDRTERLPDLRNALLLSGTHAVVASSWDVDDQSTRQLMLRFYGHLLTGAAAPQGLQRAQHDVRSAAAWKHPYFWAAFQTFTN